MTFTSEGYIFENQQRITIVYVGTNKIDKVEKMDAEYTQLKVTYKNGKSEVADLLAPIDAKNSTPVYASRDGYRALGEPLQ